MRPLTNNFKAAVLQPKIAKARVTFRQTRPIFTTVALTDSLGLTDPANIDSCEYLTGILRAVNYLDTLFTQYIPDVNAAWPAWFNTGISLMANCRPAVDAGRVWYQLASGNIHNRHYNTWTTVANSRSLPSLVIIAPIGTRAWGLWNNAGRTEIVSLQSDEANRYSVYGDITFPQWMDAVSVDGKEYFYLMDRADGRIIEVIHAGGASGVTGRDSYGVGKSIIPIDAISQDYGLKMGYANVIGGKAVVTGQLTRTSDGAPIVMDTYLLGPDQFSLGRDMYIQSDYPINGKMLLVGNKLVVSGVGHYMIADATVLFGNDNAALKLTTSDFSQFTLGEAESRSTMLDMDLSPALSHAAISNGSEATIEMTYDDGVNADWVTLAKCDIDELNQPKDEGGDGSKLHAIGRSSKRLGAWSPDQGVHVPSQATVFADASDMSQMVRASGIWEKVVQGSLAPMRNTEFNKLGVMYMAARPSRGSAVRGKFYFPAVTNFTPYFGVAVNYYKDTAEDYLARQNIDAGIYGSTNPKLIYTGTWTTVADVNAYDGFVRRTAVVGSKVSFDFYGRRFLASWIPGSSGATSVYIDNVQQDNTSDVSFLSKKLALGTHHVELRSDWGGFNELYPVRLDRVEILPITLSDGHENWGHNGLLAVYGATEHSGGPGISLNLWKDDGMTKITSASVALGSNTWYWMQIEFIEGEVRVKYRANTSTAWTEAILYLYNQAQSPWPREALGRGAIVTMNVTPSRQHYGLGSADLTVGSSDYVADFPAPNGTLIIDQERIDYNFVIGGRNGAQEDQYPMGSGIERFDSSGVSINNGMHCGNAYALSGSSGTYNGAAVAFLEKEELTWELAWQARAPGYVGGRTLRMSYYVGVAPREWWGTDPEDGYVHKGNLAYGAWSTGEAGRLWSLTEEPYASLGLPRSTLNGPYSTETTLAAATICGGFNVERRGAGSTVAVAHKTGRLSLYVNAYVLVDKVGYFTQDEDQSLEDAITSIVKLSGGKATCASAIDAVADMDIACPLLVIGAHQNFMTTFEIPYGSNRAGVCFRGQGTFLSPTVSNCAPVGNSIPGAYALLWMRTSTTYELGLFNLSGIQNLTEVLIEKVPYVPNKPGGTANVAIPWGECKVSVQGNVFSVWLNGRYIHSFCDDRYPTGDNVAFYSNTGQSFDVRISELDDLLPDVVVGVRGTGMSVLSELIADRHILFRDEPDGSMHFYRARSDIGNFPDVVSSRDITLSDTIVSRLRAEGIALAEIINKTYIKMFGNVFATVNARYANTLVETEKEANLLMAEAARGATTYRYGLVPYPLSQPGDTIHIGTDVVSVRSQVISIGFQGESFHADMQIEAVSSEAP